MNYYGNLNNPTALQSAQTQLAQSTGEQINGAVGGLPVAEQNQEYFLVFDEAGSTGPEIIDKTQFRVTYVVDSNLNTSKPTEETDAALNATQNFEKGRNCLVRADNGTILNNILTGDQSIYDIGTLQLVSTTEYGKQNDSYITTMSFNTVDGQTVGNAQNLSAVFGQGGATDNQITSDGSRRVELSNLVVPISQSESTYEWISWNTGTNSDTLNFEQSTVTAGTRLQGYFGFNLQVNSVFATNPVTVQIQYRLDRNDGFTELIGDTFAETFNTQPGKDGENFSLSSNITFPFQDFSQGDNISVTMAVTGLTNDPLNLVYLKSATLSFSQETPAGEVLIFGVNAMSSSYWSGFTTISGSGIDPNDLNSAYSILTASADLSTFANGQYIQRMTSSIASFDPEGDGNTFNPIQVPFEFKTGDEIRFEYNKNKVHKVIKTEQDEDGLKVHIKPGVNTEQIRVFNSEGTQLNHFTHYRILQNGGYLFINQKKDNEAGVEQNFNGIITPQFPSQNLQNKGDQLIFDLKQAGIIET